MLYLKERTVFLDKRKFPGPVYEQIVEATDFVLRNIRLGATIDGLVRKNREKLVNNFKPRPYYHPSPA